MKVIKESSPKTIFIEDAIQMLLNSDIYALEISSKSAPSFLSTMKFKGAKVRPSNIEEYINITDSLKNEVSLKVADFSKIVYNDGFKLLAIDTKGNIEYTFEFN